MAEIDVETLDDEHEQRNDFRRSNGSPLVTLPDNPEKSVRYRRPSSYAKVLDDESALTEWRIWKAMEGVARTPSLAAMVVATDDNDKETKKTLRAAAADKGTANEAADMGTALHAMTARYEDPNDTKFDPPEQYLPDLGCYYDCLKLYGLVSEMVEVHFVNDDFKGAGTADRVYRTTRPLATPDGQVWPEGTLFLGDLKTGKKIDLSLPGYMVQLAVYATGQLYDVKTERRLPTPPINQQWTILVHLPAGKAHCKLYWCSVNVGLKGAWLAQEVHEWQNAWKRASDGEHDIHEITPPYIEAERARDRVLTKRDAVVVDVFDADAAAGTPPRQPTIIESLQGRIDKIAGIPEAKQSLLINWPEGVPSPKKGIEDPDHVLAIDALLSRVEKQFSVSF